MYKIRFAICVVIGAALIAFLRPHTSTTPATDPLASAATSTKTAIFGGGCFWCTESDFEKLSGVVEAVSGYTGGTNANPTYSDYAEGGHREVVEVGYDPTQVSYENLVLYLIKHSDPTDGEGSFHDRGQQYAPAVYYANDAERQAAEKVFAEVNAKKVYEKPLAVALLPRVKFWPAEEYHQDYSKKNPLRYNYYRRASGRDAFIEAHWGKDTAVPSVTTSSAIAVDPTKPWTNYHKPAEAELRLLLTPVQYNVTQEKGTEHPFENEYDTNKAAGIYVDILSGEPLYSSRDKFDSGTGWPSFVKPITPDAVTLHEDNTFFTTRSEVRSRYADSHLGHVFDDGPKDRGGKRYCMNSASLRFVAKADMVAKGYGGYLSFVE